MLQLVHTLIYGGAWACLAGLWVYALTGRLERALPVFIAAPVLIGVGLALNGGECVFQTWAKTLSGVEEGWARDILILPEALVLGTVSITAPILIFGLAGALFRFFRGRKSAL